MLEVYGYMNSSYSLISIFVRLQVNEKPAFSKMISTRESVWKDPFSVTVFTGNGWTVGQTGEKNNSGFKQKRMRVDGAFVARVRDL